MSGAMRIRKADDRREVEQEMGLMQVRAEMSVMEAHFDKVLQSEKHAHEQELLQLRELCEESAEQVDGIMQSLDEKEAEIDLKNAEIGLKNTEIEGLQGKVASLGCKAARLERLETNFSRAIYEALGLVEDVVPVAHSYNGFRGVVYAA